MSQESQESQAKMKSDRATQRQDIFVKVIGDSGKGERLWVIGYSWDVIRVRVLLKSRIPRVYPREWTEVTTRMDR